MLHKTGEKAYEKVASDRFLE